ncbi:uncharacterized protein LOC142554406 [Primulina tabacum]|uniref:uncharacterized protein LOC142554406 n=1 Tax=Primulina tabacum TaxID=48773 RepID=UPI003F59FB0A
MATLLGGLFFSLLLCLAGHNRCPSTRCNTSNHTGIIFATCCSTIPKLNHPTFSISSPTTSTDITTYITHFKPICVTSIPACIIFAIFQLNRPTTSNSTSTKSYNSKSISVTSIAAYIIYAIFKSHHLEFHHHSLQKVQLYRVHQIDLHYRLYHLFLNNLQTQNTQFKPHNKVHPSQEHHHLCQQLFHLQQLAPTTVQQPTPASAPATPISPSEGPSKRAPEGPIASPIPMPKLVPPPSSIPGEHRHKHKKHHASVSVQVPAPAQAHNSKIYNGSNSWLSRAHLVCSHKLWFTRLYMRNLYWHAEVDQCINSNFLAT